MYEFEDEIFKCKRILLVYRCRNNRKKNSAILVNCFNFKRDIDKNLIFFFHIFEVLSYYFISYVILFFSIYFKLSQQNLA